MVVADKVAEQFLIGAADLGTRHRSETLKKLARFEELPAGGRRDIEALGRLHLMESEEQPVVRGLLRMGEDVVTPHPAEEDEADQEENEDRPTEEAVRVTAAPVPGVRLIAVVAFACHVIRKEEPQGELLANENGRT
jgi:hypothetical protein